MLVRFPVEPGEIPKVYIFVCPSSPIESGLPFFSFSFCALQFGRYIVARPGSLQFKRIGILGQRDRALIIAASFGVVLILIGCFLLVMWCRSRRMKREFERRFEVRWAEQEKCVARVFKNGQSTSHILFYINQKFSTTSPNIVSNIVNDAFWV